MPPITRAHSSARSEANPASNVQPTDEGSVPMVQWSLQQMDALFAIACQKAKQELQAITAKVRRDDKESQARFAAIRTPAITTSLVDPTRTERDKKDSFGEASPVILSSAGAIPAFTKPKLRVFTKID